MSEQERNVRLQRLEALREAGVDPYPPRTGAYTPIAEVRAAHDEKDGEQLESENNEVAIVGRVKSHRSFGKLVFFTLVESGVALQVSARKSEIDPEIFRFANKKIDIGDFVRVEGRVWRTQKGELSVDLAQAQMLSKALLPLPEKWHGLQDQEARYRQRYLDLLSNERSREIAILRSRTISAVRRFLDERDFLEVETPVLQPLYGGAAAEPFVTHHDKYDQQLYLRISDELYLKRLVIGGLDRVYEIAHNFRNEGISHKHSPEFTMMECYQAFADYQDMMDLVQGMVRAAAEAATGSLSVKWGDDTLELGGEWKRVSMQEAIVEATGIDILEATTVEALRAAAKEKGIGAGDAPTWAVLVDDLFSEHVEPGLMQPTFITHHPTELSPLAKKSPDDPRVVERFELFMAGMELANAYSELNDPIDQRARFDEQRVQAEAGDDEAHPMDEDFLTAMEHGMPPTGGLGVGIDRVVRILADAANLREVILFPHLRSGDS